MFNFRYILTKSNLSEMMTSEGFRTHREKIGMTRKELADHLGVTEQAIYCWEKGTREIPKMVGLAMIWVIICDAHNIEL